jgi:hypothetical protein
VNDVDIRALFLAEANDDALGSTSVDIDAVIRRERRARQRRRWVAGTCAVALVTGGILLGPTLAGAWGHRAVPPAVTASPVPTQPATVDAGNAIALRVLLDNFTGATAGPPYHPFGMLGGIGGGGKQTLHGQIVAYIIVSAMFRPSEPDNSNPCIPKPDPTTGMQGAPRAGQVCTSYPQPDGTVVWVHSTDQGGGSRVVSASQFRTNGALVEVSVYYGRPATEFPPFPDALLVHTVTDPRLIPLPRPH